MNDMDQVDETVDGAKSDAADIISAVKEKGEEMKDKAGDLAEGAGNALKNAASGLKDAAGSAVAKLETLTGKDLDGDGKVGE